MTALLPASARGRPARGSLGKVSQIYQSWQDITTVSWILQFYVVFLARYNYNILDTAANMLYFPTDVT